MLTRDQLFRAAPSIFASEPWVEMSERYAFVPTIQVVELLAEQSFYPVRASQSRTRIPGKGDYTRHMIRFRQENGAIQVGAEIPELVLTNSHDGTACYNFMSGVFRLVCSNGMVVQSANFGSVRVKHMGQGDLNARVVEATNEVIADMPRTMSQIETWKSITLTSEQRLTFATAALELRDRKLVTPAQLLSSRRMEDSNNSLWATSNVVQENMLKGGIRGRNPETGRRATTRSIVSVTEDIRLNRALWRLTEAMGEQLTSKEATERYVNASGETANIRYEVSNSWDESSNSWHTVSYDRQGETHRQYVVKTVEEARDKWREVRALLKSLGYSRV